MNGQFSLSARSRTGHPPGELLVHSSLLVLRTTPRSGPNQSAWPSSIAAPNSVTALLLGCSCQILPNFPDFPSFFWFSFMPCRSRERYRRSALCLSLGYLWVYFAVAILVAEGSLQAYLMDPQVERMAEEPSSPFSSTYYRSLTQRCL